MDSPLETSIARSSLLCRGLCGRKVWCCVEDGRKFGEPFVVSVACFGILSESYFDHTFANVVFFWLRKGLGEDLRFRAQFTMSPHPIWLPEKCIYYITVLYIVV